MYNREFDGGADVPDKVHVGGVPVEKILPSIGKNDNDSDLEQDGGNPHKKCSGPFANKVVPAGLVLIQIRRDPDVEYEEHVHPGVNREVVPESLYDMLVGSVLHPFSFKSPTSWAEMNETGAADFAFTSCAMRNGVVEKRRNKTPPKTRGKKVLTRRKKST